MTKQFCDPAQAAKATIQRLFQMRQLWEDAAKYYFDPPRFQLSLQNCIMVSRTVTFILQSNKGHVEGFEAWYDTYKARWTNDPLMCWARDARNLIEKQGDLVTHSQVRASVIAGYLNGPTTNWLPQSLFMSPEQMYQSVRAKIHDPHIVEHGTLLIERRWIDKGLPDTEVLEALSYVYSQFADMMVDFMNVNRLKAPARLVDTKPDALGALAMDRALYLSLRDGSTTGFRFFKKQIDIPKKKITRLVWKRYGAGATWAKLRDAVTFEAVARVYFENARLVLLRDGHHRGLTFLLKGTQVVQIIPSDHPTRASRYVLMRDLAKLARIEGADGVFMIAEAWLAENKDLPKSGFAVDAKRRSEALVLDAASASGDKFSMHAQFYRRNPKSKKIRKVDLANVERVSVPFLVLPFLQEWGVLDMQRLEADIAALDAANNGFIPGKNH